MIDKRKQDAMIMQQTKKNDTERAGSSSDKAEETIDGVMREWDDTMAGAQVLNIRDFLDLCERVFEQHSPDLAPHLAPFMDELLRKIQDKCSELFMKLAHLSLSKTRK
ncbi:MAG: hypothetical protein JW839_00165 [Candidatus Lokiarchaeota archaeon]|nr:hypothetical protein [Candidatus Lokiarchaeota archaeon]